MGVPGVIPCCCSNDCEIQIDAFDGTLSGFTTTGTPSVAAGLLEMSAGDVVEGNTDPTNATDAIHFRTYPQTADATAKMRLECARTDADNLLFGELSIAAGAGTIRVGVREEGIETWLSDPETLEDVNAELNDRSTLTLCWEPGPTIDPIDGFIESSALSFTNTNIWNDPDESLWVIDDVYTSSDGFTGTIGEKWGGFNFESIPFGSTINGLEVAIKIYGTENSGAFTPTVETVQFVDQDDNLVGDDKAASEATPIDDTVQMGWGGSTDDWNITGLSAAMLRSASFGIYFAFNFDSNEVFIDSVTVRVFYTAPSSEGGTLALTYRNTASPNTVQCASTSGAFAPGAGKAAAISVQAGDWDYTDYELKYHQSGSRPSCPTCDCTVPGITCGSCVGTTVDQYVVDLGVGGWTDGTCDECDLVAGEYTLSRISLCDWTGGAGTEDVNCYGVGISASIVPGVTGFFWQVIVFTALGLTYARYQGAILDSGDCGTDTVTLTKVSEGNGAGVCGGSLPATITIEPA